MMGTLQPEPQGAAFLSFLYNAMNNLTLVLGQKGDYLNKQPSDVK